MSDEQYEPTAAERFGSSLYGIAVLVMNVSFAIAGVAALYLLYGILSGGMSGVDSLPAADKARVFGVVSLAGKALTGGLALGTLALTYVMLGEDMAGYVIFVAAAAIGFGIQFAYTTFGGTVDSGGVKRAFSAFHQAAYVPAAIGALLILRDVVLRFISALQPKEINSDTLTYGNEARVEAKPIRTSLLAKCWEGPYCRDFVRVHCPIFIKRQACWRVKQGCYCEEEIVSAAAAKVQGVHLEMAPNKNANFANAPTQPVTSIPPSSAPIAPTAGLSAVGSAPKAGGMGRLPDVVTIQIGNETPTSVVTNSGGYQKRDLSPAQKRERCRNCVIYNEHQREKYKILLPVVFVGGIALCAIFAVPLRELFSASIMGVDRLLAHISFNTGAAPKLQRPAEGAAWALVGAFGLMFLSKMLQLLEWACFKVKI